MFNIFNTFIIFNIYKCYPLRLSQKIITLVDVKDYKSVLNSKERNEKRAHLIKSNSMLLAQS